MFIVAKKQKAVKKRRINEARRIGEASSENICLKQEGGSKGIEENSPNVELAIPEKDFINGGGV